MSLNPNTKAEVRRNQYKVAVDAEEGRRRREESMVEVRKIKREESLMKKRREVLDEFSGLVDTKLETLSDMVAGVWSDDLALQLKYTTQIRALLSRARDPLIDEVIDSGVVPRFVEFLKKEDNPKIQYEAAWALTNIVSGTSNHTKVVVDLNAVPIFVHLLASSPSDDVRELAVWALGNIAGDSPQFCTYVLKCGALANPAAFQALERLIHSTDEQVLEKACWALKYLSKGTDEKIQIVIEAGVVPRLVELLLHPSIHVLIPALLTVGNIVTGNDLQTQCVIDSGALPCFLNILTHNYKKDIKKDACWTISNITAGTQEQIQMVIEANLIDPLVHLLQYAEFDIKKEAAWAIYNVTSGCHDQVKYLVEQGCITPLCDLLLCADPKIIIICLKGLENILKVGEAEKNLGNTGDMNYYTYLIDDAGGLENMMELQDHDNSEIYEKAVKVMETYWV
ncbi:Armadillo [Arabidopsis suecica]|uniref:Importin subunit alpha n=1 Tax=Arabidopsis suecica TaxID=45249 RepID=A0A8T2HDR0_ARASU|nr:Armadillo [Arabidopsis suecica]